jgi:hypothetical protein
LHTRLCAESIDVGPVLSAVDAATAQYFNFAQAGNEMADPASIVVFTKSCEKRQMSVHLKLGKILFD